MKKLSLLVSVLFANWHLLTGKAVCTGIRIVWELTPSSRERQNLLLIFQLLMSKRARIAIEENAISLHRLSIIDVIGF